MSDVTQILNQIESGDPKAADQLLPLVYEELRKLAAAKLAHEKSGQTLQPTALVHEAYLRIAGNGLDGQNWSGRGHFFAAAAEAMRRILVENARRKGSKKAGQGLRRIELVDAPDIQFVPSENDSSEIDIVGLSDALDELQQLDARAAELVKLRFFTGLTRSQAAEILGVSVPTVDNDWAYAKTWLKLRLSRDQ